MRRCSDSATAHSSILALTNLSWDQHFEALDERQTVLDPRCLSEENDLAGLLRFEADGAYLLIVLDRLD